MELFGGPFVARYSIEGATAHAGFLFGAEAMARLAPPCRAAPASLSRRAPTSTAIGCASFWPDDGTGYATPRLELTIGVGLAWDWTS